MRQRNTRDYISTLEIISYEIDTHVEKKEEGRIKKWPSSWRKQAEKDKERVDDQSVRPKICIDKEGERKETPSAQREIKPQSENMQKDT